MRKPEKTICKTGHRWEDNNIMDHNEIRWFHFVQDRDKWQAVVHTVMNIQVPQSAGNSSTNFVRWRRTVLCGLVGWKCV